MFIFREYFERHFFRGVPRLAYQWEKSVNAAIEEMRIQAITYVQEELTTIEVLLPKTQGRSGEIQQLIAQLQ